MDTLFGLTGETWDGWCVFLKTLYGVPLDPSELETFRECTGRQAPNGAYDVACVISPRQVGKTTIAAMLACVEAILWDGEPGAICALVAQDSRGAQRASLRYVETFFQRPKLSGMVTARNQWTLSLDNDCAIAVYPCRPAALRSMRSPLIVLDEAAHFQSSEGYPRDVEAFAAALPTTYSTHGKVLVLSSPERQDGLLWSMYQKHCGKPSPVLVWKAPKGTMRTLDAATEKRHRILELEDPIKAASENDGEFRAGASLLFDPDRLDACLVEDQKLPQRSSVQYVCFLDVNLGRKDKNALAIGHLDGDRIVVDVVRSWSSSVSRDEVTTESARAMKAYGLTEAWCDRVAGDWAQTDYARHGVKLRQEAEPKASLYMSLLAAVNRRSIGIPSQPDLVRQLRLLERRPRAGRDWIDLPRNQSEDEANALAGLCWLLTTEQQEEEPGFMIGGTMY